uniref:DUF4939 domain-containing protein n=1 Tax=Scleropages formosus TaxID=113540 RepID=A0A8C9V3N1_SCLFO
MPASASAVPPMSSAVAPFLPAKDPQLAMPKRYHGVPEKCRGFILQCELVFASQSQVYQSDMSRITYMISLLTGPALDWATALWYKRETTTYMRFLE